MGQRGSVTLERGGRIQGSVLQTFTSMERTLAIVEISKPYHLDVLWYVKTL